MRDDCILGRNSSPWFLAVGFLPPLWISRHLYGFPATSLDFLPPLWISCHLSRSPNCQSLAMSTHGQDCMRRSRSGSIFRQSAGFPFFLIIPRQVCMLYHLCTLHNGGGLQTILLFLASPDALEVIVVTYSLTDSALALT